MVRKSKLAKCKEIAKSIKSAVRKEGYKDVEVQIHDDSDGANVVVFIKRLTKKKQEKIAEASTNTPTFWMPDMRKQYTANGYYYSVSNNRHVMSFYPL